MSTQSVRMEHACLSFSLYITHTEYFCSVLEDLDLKPSVELDYMVALLNSPRADYHTLAKRTPRISNIVGIMIRDIE